MYKKLLHIIKKYLRLFYCDVKSSISPHVDDVIYAINIPLVINDKFYTIGRFQPIILCVKIVSLIAINRF